MLKKIYLSPVLLTFFVAISLLIPQDVSAQFRFPMSIFGTPEPTIQPTSTPTGSPTATATPSVSASPSASPSPSVAPTTTPIVTATPPVSPEPTSEPTPTATPSPSPTASPTQSPTPVPTQEEDDDPPVGIVAGINNIIDAIQGDDPDDDGGQVNTPSNNQNVVSRFIEPLARPFSNNYYQEEYGIDKGASQIITIGSLTLIIAGIALLWRDITRSVIHYYLSIKEFIKQELSYGNEGLSTS